MAAFEQMRFMTLLRPVCFGLALCLGWLGALLTLSGCYASHRSGASAGDGPADATVDAGPNVDPSGNHPCFDLGERACNRYPPNDDSRGCLFVTQRAIDECASWARFEGCFPWPRSVVDDPDRPWATEFGCRLARPCPHGSKWCVVGECPLTGFPRGINLEECAFPMEDTDPAPGYTFPEDHHGRCIPLDADPSDFGCAVYEVTNGD